MLVLIVLATLATGTLGGLLVLLRSRLKTGADRFDQRLLRGVGFGVMSSTMVLVFLLLVFRFPPIHPSLTWPLTLCALAGNALNVTALLFCLRRISAEALFVALILGLTQVLWLLLALRTLTIDF